MRILQIGKFYPPSHGGMETLLKNISEGLAAAGDEVTVLCSADRNSPQPARRASGEPERAAGVEILRAPSHGTLFSQPLSPALPLWIARLGRRFDLVHLHTPNPLAETAALMLPGRVPLVVSYHSDIVRQRLLLPFYTPIQRRLLDRAARIVVATGSHITHSPYLSPLRPKCEVIPYGITEPPAGTDAGAAELVRRHGRFVLFVGRLVGYKGVTVLLEALRRNSVSCVIAGTGPLGSELEGRIREYGIGDRVHLAGFVPDERLADYLRACGLLVLPSVSKNEAFGLVQVEAMAHGKPVITTRLDSGISEVGEEGVTGLLVAPNNPEELARSMEELLADESRLKRMGTAARARFERLYTRDKMVESYRALFRRVMES